MACSSNDAPDSSLRVLQRPFPHETARENLEALLGIGTPPHARSKLCPRSMVLRWAAAPACHTAEQGRSQIFHQPTVPTSEHHSEKHLIHADSRRVLSSRVAQPMRVAYRSQSLEEDAVTSELGTLRVLIIQAHPSVREGLEPALARVGVCNAHARNDAEGIPVNACDDVDVAFLDGRLSWERARSWLRALPGTARVVVLGSGASREAIFRLGQEGAHDYLEPPFTDDDVRRSMEERSDRRSRLKGIVRCLVGRVSLKDAQQSVRSTMLDEALHACGGSRRSAARLLGVTRPAVQRMLRERPTALGEDHGQ